MKPESMSFQPVPFAQITPEIAATWWARFKNRSGKQNAEHLQLGKILVWDLEQAIKSTGKKVIPKKLIRDKYDGIELLPRTYACAKIFRVVLEGRFPSLTEEVYDNLPVGKASARISPNLATLTDVKVAEIIMGVSGQHSLSWQSIDSNFPKRGIIYVMVTSADLECSKLGGSWNSDPYESAKAMFRRGTPAAAKNVPVWWEQVSDWKAAEKVLKDKFSDVEEPNEVFRVRAKEAIVHCMSVGRQFPVPA